MARRVCESTMSIELWQWQLMPFGLKARHIVCDSFSTFFRGGLGTASEPRVGLGVRADLGLPWLPSLRTPYAARAATTALSRKGQSSNFWLPLRNVGVLGRKSVLRILVLTVGKGVRGTPGRSAPLPVTLRRGRR